MKIIFLLLLVNISLLANNCTKDKMIKMRESGYQKFEIGELCSIQQVENDNNKKNNENSFQNQYVKVSFGRSDITYHSETDNAFNEMENTNSADRDQIAVDFGMYSYMDKHSVLGLNLNMLEDTLYDSNTDTIMSMSTFFYSLSYMYFSDKVRNGVYFRGDIGVAKSIFDSIYLEETIQSEFGIGAGAGIGYFFEFNETGYGLECFLTNYRIEGDNVSSTQFLLSLMF